MREVREAEAERHRRPGVDRGQPHQHRADQPQQHRMPLQPVRPVGRAGMIVERPVVGHQHERRIADQRRHPRRRERIGRSDVRIERAQRQHVADRRERHVDHEHEGDQPVGQPHRIAQHGGRVAADELAEPRRHDREHEGEEEALHRPAAQVRAYRLRVDSRRPHQPCAEAPGAVAGFGQATVDPQHIGDRQREQRGRGGLETPHREGEIALPVEAPGGVDQRDSRPGQPQPGELGQADVDRLAPRTRMRPVDPGRGAAVHLVDCERPDHHRHPARRDVAQRRIGAVEPIGARHTDPAEQPGQSGEPDAAAHRRTGPRIGARLRRELRVVIHGRQA